MLAMTRRQKGFSLIELAIVLFIVGLLLGGLLNPLATSVEAEQRQTTMDKLDEIKDALAGYAIINGRLPCPDCPDNTIGTCNAGGIVNDGIEDRSGSTPTQVCRTDVGNLPWAELGVVGHDEWENYYTYQVSPNFSRESNTSACGTATAGMSFELCTSGNIDIRDTYNNPYAGTPNIADNVIAVVVSHGKNFFSSAQQDQEVENYGRNPVSINTGSTILSSYTASNYDANVFIKREYSLSNNNVTYDDMLVWLSPNTIMNKMVSAGKLP